VELEKSMAKENAENSLIESGSMLRLEIAQYIPSFGRCWCLLDWVKDQEKIPAEIQRVLNRFSRISLSLERQSKGVRAKNEPYADVIGVRCKMGSRTIGIWFGEHRDLQYAPTASSVDWKPEQEFERMIRESNER
jgi:hypothetical protein